MAVILLSGGLDSAVNLAIAAQKGNATLALTLRYGQRAEAAESHAASALAQYFHVPWKEIPLHWLGEVNPTVLTRPEMQIPQPLLSELDSFSHGQASAQAVWVANRNGVFLNIAAAFAESMGVNEVIAGFNREEAATFADNSPAFVEATNLALAFSTRNGVFVDSYTLLWDKSQIIREAFALQLPLDLVWSCYQPGPLRCWRCESCRRTERALLTQGESGRGWLLKMGWVA